MATWTIKGEAGMGLDATVRTIQSLGIDAATLEFGALSDDVFLFSMPTTTAAGAGIDGVNRIPTLGQEITLFKDGDRKFIGHAVAPEVDIDRVNVVAKGPWDWMSKIPVSQVKSGTRDTGADGTRPSYAFPQQTLKESLRLLNNAARDAGVPVANINEAEVNDFISSMFTVLKTTISSKSWADALSDLMAWCVDGVPWYDHSGTNNAKFNVTRRGDMTPLTLTMGSGIIENKIRPRLDLEVKRVELHYVTRHPTTGLPRWARQAHGTAVAGKVQMVPVSGPDVAVLIPKDDFDKVDVKTHSSGTPNSDYVKTRAGTIAANIKTFGAMGGIISTVTGYIGSSWEVAKYGGVAFPKLAVTKPNGDSISLTGKYLMLTTEMPDWLRKKLNGQDVLITGTWGSIFTQTDTIRTPTATWQKWYNAAPLKGSMWANEKTGPSSDPLSRRWWAMPFECTGVLINAQYAAKTAVYRPWDYDFLSPPNNLAENLRDAQDWVPWEGRIVHQGDEVSGDNVLNRKIRLAGSLAVCATMDALLKRVSYDIVSGRTTYTLGAPARTDFGSMIKRIQRQAADNITYLT